METWELIRTVFVTEREKFCKAYKCINKNTFIRPETVRKHLGTLVVTFEAIRNLLHQHSGRLTKEHEEEGLEFYWETRDKLVKIFSKYQINQEVPHTLSEPVIIDLDRVLTPESLEKLSPIGEDQSDADTDSDKEVQVQDSKNTLRTKMPLSAIDFINTASRLIPDFDGRPENLKSFLDALQLVGTVKETHDAIAVTLVKTKLRGTARNIIGNEATLEQVINKLKTSVKGESVEVLTAKIMNIQQSNKSANVYAKEIEDMTRALENAYIGDGLPLELAGKYSTQTAVKAMTKNCKLNEVKLVMRAGQFHTMNEVVAKFVNTCTETTGSENTILHLKTQYHGNNQGRFQRGRGGYNRGGNRSRRNNGRSNYNNNQNGYQNNYNGGNYRGGRGGRSNYSGNHYSNNSVRAMTNNQTGSENQNQPLSH